MWFFRYNREIYYTQKNMENTQTQSVPKAEIPSSVDPQKILLTWQAQVQPHFDRSKQWYQVAGGCVLAVAAYGIITKSWSLTIVTLLCGAMYYLIRDHVPAVKTITLMEGGVKLEEKFVSWENLAGFWFLQTPDYTELHFVPKTAKQSEFHIQTGTQDISGLRMLIGNHIPELADKKENLLDAFTRIAKL